MWQNIFDDKWPFNRSSPCARLLLIWSFSSRSRRQSMKKSNRRILRVFSKVDGSIVSHGNHTFQQKFDIGGIQSNKNEIESLFHPCLFCVEIILLFIFFQCLKVSGPQDAKVSRSRISHKFKENMWRWGEILLFIHYCVLLEGWLISLDNQRTSSRMLTRRYTRCLHSPR